MECIGLYSTGITSSCSSLSTALHKTKSIRFTPPNNCESISDSVANTTVLEKLKLNNGSDIAYHTIIRGISSNNSIKKLKFYQGHFHHQTILDLVQVMKSNKTITELTMSDINVSPRDCLLLADVLTMNTSIKKMYISPREKFLGQSLVLQFLKQLQHNYTMELLLLRVTGEVEDDKQFIRGVEISVEHMNNIRQSLGVTTPLHVELL